MKRRFEHGKIQESQLPEFAKTEVVSTDFSGNPTCGHGPTILFSRGDCKFYACSAYRSRKLCPFYMKHEQWKGDKGSGSKLVHHTKHVASFDRTLNKGQAQYLFSKTSLEFITGTLDALKIGNVICVGVPTVHSSLGISKSNSCLLDIDLQFKNEPNFFQYNMCNHFFFSEDGQMKYLQFLGQCTDEEVAIICDPPFGARLELIIHSLQQIRHDLQTVTKAESLSPKVFLVHPYFSEGKILKIDPTIRMCDYKIEYELHKKFKNSSKSPVRIFTNVPLDKITFPASDNATGNHSDTNQYKFCPICDKNVFKISEHCAICNYCNSKDGKPYVHCPQCGICVKESWQHCHACNSCHFPGNKCKTKNISSESREIAHIKQAKCSKLVNPPATSKMRRKLSKKKRKTK